MKHSDKNKNTDAHWEEVFVLRAMVSQIRSFAVTGQSLSWFMMFLFFVAYLSGAFLGGQLSVHHEVATIWPPAGIYLAGLLLAPTRLWPVLMATAWCASMTYNVILAGSTLQIATAFWGANTIEALAGATYLNWVAGKRRPFSLNSLNHVLVFACAGAIVPPAIGGLIAATAVHYAYGAPFWITWHAWWSGYAMGTLIIAPILLSFADPKLRIPDDKWSSTEAVLTCGVLIVTGYWAVAVSGLLTAYIVFLVLLLIALRFEIRGAVLANFVLSIISFWHISQEFEALPIGAVQSDRFLMVQLFLGLVTIFCLAIAAAVFERRSAQEASYISTLRYQHFAETTSDPMIIMGPESRLISANNAWRVMTGYSETTMATLSVTIRDLVHPADRSQLEALIQKAAQREPIGRFDMRLITRDGKTVSLDGTCDARYENQQLVEIYAVIRDVTQQKVADQENADYRQQLESANARLRSLSITDSLTHLYNRRFFQQRLDEEYERTRRYGAPLSLLLIDVDHFKQFNDTHGHLAGDRVLSKVGESLMESARTNDIVARYGGEEFAAILPMTDQQGGIAVAERIRQTIESGVWFGQQITVSIGVATVSEQYTEVAQLISAADNALYASKHNGRNQVTGSDQLTSSSEKIGVEKLSMHR